MENLLSWFKLKGVPGIGNHLFKRLIDRFKLPEHVFEASDADLATVQGISPRLIASMRKAVVPSVARRDIERAHEKGYTILTMADRNYPPLLLQIPDPPAYLYAYGDPSFVKTRNISIVGTRNPTRYGMQTAERFGKDLTVFDIVVASGMARGIDTAAHIGAIKGRGKTIAVLGSGFECIYPAENVKLFHTIAEHGCVFSEFPLSTPPEPHNFPFRNRIISGLSLGTVVIEAAAKSGSLITARLAADQNREVFAVPGNVHSLKSAGTHALIKQGAALVVDARDIVEELEYLLNPPADRNHPETDPIRNLPPLSEDETLVFHSLGPYPIHIDELGRKVSMDSGKLSGILFQLELKGIVHQSPGKYFTAESENTG